ncbi:LysR family transcriptional regulator [Martelella lutilitoris]|uniref:LysR family transcriptional regulator n=1 Tax=Martelella lutilitoris TaxID=2583532 RepID=A0A5C4JW38_9HYPH|nr:LysR family transcriptional regulator [Martelella lutilitoris]TNB49586.1 LysR family transcriptional regulator [Martelella lutilitoris]
MIWDAVRYDWNQVRAFLATAEEGSLSAAARALKVTQPTLSRQVAGLEESLGVTLFERGTRSMTLTSAGRQLLVHARTMNDAANNISLAASGHSQAVEGEVCVAATNAMATYHLPAVVAKIRKAAPGIALDIKTSNALSDLIRREADIAIRHARPTEPELIAKQVGVTSATMYASKRYLDRLGRPVTIEKLKSAEFFGFEFREQLLPVFAEEGITLTVDNFPVITESGTLVMELMRAGLGIGLLLKEDVALFPDLEAVFPAFRPISVPIWLVTHRELHSSRRIRVVYDILADHLSRLSSDRQ